MLGESAPCGLKVIDMEKRGIRVLGACDGIRGEGGKPQNRKRVISRRGFCAVAGASVLISPLIASSPVFSLGKGGGGKQRKPRGKWAREDMVAMEEMRIIDRGVERVGELEEAGAVPALIGILHGKKDVVVRMRAAQALGRIGGRRAEDALIIRGRKRPEDLSLRKYCLDILGKGGSDRAVAAAIRALGDGDSRMRVHAVGVVARIGGKRAEDALVPLVRDRNCIVRCKAIEALGGLRARGAVPAIKRILKNKNEVDYVRVEALGALGRIGGKDALGVLGEMANRDLSGEKRGYAIKVLDWENGYLHTASVVSALSNRSVDVRLRAVGVLAGRKERMASDALRGALKDGNAGVREEAGRVLGMRKNTWGYQP